MTTEQKNRISEMRKAGMSYAEIADRLCITKEAVRSYCRNHKITAESAKPETTLPVCPQCGMPVHQIAGRKKKRFCSVSCCQLWWNAHPEKVRQKALYHYTCAGCGKAFTAYGNSHRKYCSHECYIKDRYKENDAL